MDNIRKVKFLEYVKDLNTGDWNSQISEGVFLAFGIDYHQSGMGVGHYTSAIIEMPSGRVYNIPVEDIVFIK